MRILRGGLTEFNGLNSRILHLPGLFQGSVLNFVIRLFMLFLYREILTHPGHKMILKRANLKGPGTNRTFIRSILFTVYKCIFICYRHPLRKAVLLHCLGSLNSKRNLSFQWLRIITVFKEKMMGRVLGMCFHRERTTLQAWGPKFTSQAPMFKKKVPNGLGPVILVLGRWGQECPWSLTASLSWISSSSSSKRPASKHTVESNWGWCQIATSVLHMHTHTLAHRCIQTWTHPYTWTEMRSVDAGARFQE